MVLIKFGWVSGMELRFRCKILGYSMGGQQGTLAYQIHLFSMAQCSFGTGKGVHSLYWRDVQWIFCRAEWLEPRI